MLRALWKFRSAHDKPNSVTRLFLIALLVIIIDQAIESVLLEAIAPIDPTGIISNSFLFLSIPFSVFLASLSDFHCRRRIILFATFSLLLSVVFIFMFDKYNNNSFAYIALACKGIGGNATPIALASIATIVSPKKFTMSLAVAICAYSIGSWVPIYFRSSAELPSIVGLATFTCFIIAIKWFKETSFDNFKLKNNTLDVHRFFSFARKDLKEIVIFCTLTSVVLTFLSFTFSETAFYQILLRGEVLLKDDFYSSLSLKMGIGYYLGTGLLFILKTKDVSDARCMKSGVVISIFSITICSASSMLIKNSLLYSLFISLFSFGFALLTPSLFSILSKIRHLDEQGKIYGLLDSTDTLAALISTQYIKSSKLATYSQVFWVSSTILFISAILMWRFINYIGNMRQGNGHQSEKGTNHQ